MKLIKNRQLRNAELKEWKSSTRFFFYRSNLVKIDDAHGRNTGTSTGTST